MGVLWQNQFGIGAKQFFGIVAGFYQPIAIAYEARDLKGQVP